MATSFPHHTYRCGIDGPTENGVESIHHPAFSCDCPCHNAWVASLNDADDDTDGVDPRYVELGDSGQFSRPAPHDEYDHLRESARADEEQRAKERRMVSINLLVRFCLWLNEHTDTFDPVIVQAHIEMGDDLKLSAEQITTLTADFIEVDG